MRSSLTRTVAGAAAFAAMAVAAPFLPIWFVALATIAFAHALVVLGLIILWRAGLVSFGQALYYAAGAYTVAMVGRFTGISDVFVLLIGAALVTGVLALIVGFLLARYREIFFAMLSLAISMILYGILVNTESLGSTDGFNVSRLTYLGMSPSGRSSVVAAFWLTIGIGAVAAFLVGIYLSSVAGSLAVPMRDNEIRIEYLGISANRLVHLKIVIAGILGGIGGGLAAITVSHVDPNMAYWTSSGGFVFITILAGAGSVAGAFVGALLFEMVRSFAVTTLPGGWQLILGTALLLTILFLPAGLSSLFVRRRRNREARAS